MVEKVQEDNSKSKPPKSKSKKHKSRLNVDNSVWAARGFYFILYGLFYLSCMLYQNKLRDAIMFVDGSFIGNITYVVYYFTISGAAIYYFMTAGKNPGFVDETISEVDKKMFELKVKKEESVDSEDCETIDMGLETTESEICTSRG